MGGNVETNIKMSAWEMGVATCILGTDSTFALRLREITGTLASIGNRYRIDYECILYRIALTPRHLHLFVIIRNYFRCVLKC